VTRSNDPCQADLCYGNGVWPGMKEAMRFSVGGDEDDHTDHERVTRCADDSGEEAEKSSNGEEEEEEVVVVMKKMR
jgi:hypothetical protein